MYASWLTDWVDKTVRPIYLVGFRDGALFTVLVFLSLFALFLLLSRKSQ
jgi:hypothetical protein